MNKLKTITLVAVVASAIIATAHAGGRVSLNGIDAKLTQLLGLGGTPVSTQAFQSVSDPVSRVDIAVYTVPAGKILAVDYVSIYLDVVVNNRPTTGLRIRGQVGGINPDGVGGTTFDMGYMEEFVRTSRGTPNFLIGASVNVYFGPGPITCRGESNFAGVGLDFGIGQCSISGRLIDAP